jgi:hypothetical protein
MVRAMSEAGKVGSPLRARGGELGGSGTPTGERVIVPFDGTPLDVFHETALDRIIAAVRVAGSA